MPRSVRAELPNGTTVQYDNVPSEVTPEQVAARVQQEYGVQPTAMKQLADPRDSGGDPNAGHPLFRQLDLAARAGATGLSTIPAAGAQGIATLYNKGADAVQGEGQGMRFPDQFSLVQQFLSKMGLPQPDSSFERIAQDSASAMAGAGGLAKAVPAMSSSIGTQVAAAGTGGGAGALARENDASPIMQIIASLLGAAGGGTAVAAGKVGPLKGIYDVTKNTFQQMTQGGRDQTKGQLLTDLTGWRKGNVITDLMNNRSATPGSTTTAAQAAAPSGATELAAAQSLLSKRYDPSTFSDMAKANTAARQGEMNKVARDAAGRYAAVQGNSAIEKSARARLAPQAAITDILSKRLADSTAKETPKRFTDLAGQVDPARMSTQQNRTIDAVHKDILTDVLVGRQASQGREAAQAALGNSFAPTAIPGMLDRRVMILRSVLGRIQGHASDRTLKELTQDMKDPAKLAEILKNAKPEEKVHLLNLAQDLGVAVSSGAAQTLPQVR